ncbi:hypothetical protein AAMO2058_000915200 [Amorphochlora amoebiformis]
MSRKMTTMSSDALSNTKYRGPNAQRDARDTQMQASTPIPGVRRSGMRRRYSFGTDVNRRYFLSKRTGPAKSEAEAKRQMIARLEGAQKIKVEELQQAAESPKRRSSRLSPILKVVAASRSLRLRRQAARNTMFPGSFHLNGIPGKGLSKDSLYKAFSLESFKFLLHQCERERKPAPDGIVTLPELIDMLQVCGMTQSRATEEATAFFDFSDVSDSGRVAIDDFCTEFIRKQHFRVINRVRKMFHNLDPDETNAVDQREILNLLSESGKLTLKALNDWYVESAQESKKNRENAIRARLLYRVDKLMRTNNTGRRRDPSPIRKSFNKKFYPVEDVGLEGRQEQFQHDLMVMELSDIADEKTEIPVISSIFGNAYSEICDIFNYYSSLNFSSSMAEIGVLQLDQVRHMMQDAELLIQSWDCEDEFLQMKKRFTGPDSLVRKGMSCGQFMELLVRIAAMHKRTLESKLDLTQWLLEIVQNHLRDKALKPLRAELLIRGRLQAESVQKVYKNYISQLWFIFHEYVPNLEEHPKITTMPIATPGLYRLLKLSFGKSKFSRRDLVHWYVLSREQVIGKDRRSTLINGGDVYWNEFLEILARLAVHTHPRCTTALALDLLCREGTYMPRTRTGYGANRYEFQN